MGKLATVTIAAKRHSVIVGGCWCPSSNERSRTAQAQRDPHAGTTADRSRFSQTVQWLIAPKLSLVWSLYYNKYTHSKINIQVL